MEENIFTDPFATPRVAFSGDITRTARKGYQSRKISLSVPLFPVVDRHRAYTYRQVEYATQGRVVSIPSSTSYSLYSVPTTGLYWPARLSTRWIGSQVKTREDRYSTFPTLFRPLPNCSLAPFLSCRRLIICHHWPSSKVNR